VIALALHYATGLGVALAVISPMLAWTAVLTWATDREMREVVER